MKCCLAVGDSYTLGTTHTLFLSADYEPTGLGNGQLMIELVSLGCQSVDGVDDR